jgi:hypothetical protein
VDDQHVREAVSEGDRATAQRALEDVCARGDFEAAETLYSPEFFDHVNDLEFRGHEGIGADDADSFRAGIHACGKACPSSGPPPASRRSATAQISAGSKLSVHQVVAVSIPAWR